MSFKKKNVFETMKEKDPAQGHPGTLKYMLSNLMPANQY